MIKTKLRVLANYADPGSLASKYRLRRFEWFKKFIQDHPRKSITILDVGGTEQFWEAMGFAGSGNHITLLNLTKEECRHENITSIAGNACDMDQIADNQFDVVFSNSVIEHVGSLENQVRMAQEIQRVAPQYFVQTPNFYFPIEPHFLVPFFHWLPIFVRMWAVQHFSIGWFRKAQNYSQAEMLVKGIRLMKYSELRRLFPEAEIITERYYGLPKSFIIMKK